MEYKGKLYGKVNKSYFPLEATTEDFQALEKRVSELESENKALRQPPVISSLPDATPHTCPECSWLCDCTAQPCSCCSGNDL